VYPAAMAARASDDYILGTDPVELERLRFQHSVWASELRDGCARAGIGPGASVLDLGSGPGFTSLELAGVVGPGGRVVAFDKSERFLEFLRREAGRRALGNVETVAGSVEEPSLPAGPFDAAYARWLLCWLPHPDAALERVAAVLRPGGRLLVQDYIAWGSMRLLPRSTEFDRGIAACLAHWRKAGIEVDVMERLPSLADAAGFHVDALRPLSRLARPGSPEWTWVTTFLLGYLPRVVAEGLLSGDAFAEFRSVVDHRTRAGTGWLATPAMAEAVLSRPS
jgi:SAM-dependent methyltransferase